MDSSMTLGKEKRPSVSGTKPIPLIRITENYFIGVLLVLGIILNYTTWYHPLYFSMVKWGIIWLLPLILILGLKKGYYLLWYVFLIFFTQDTFPNNVIYYESYYGHEQATVYFHNFAFIFSIFDIVLLSSMYVLIIKKLRERKIRNLFKGRVEYYIIWGVVLLSLMIAFARGNNLKTAFAEIQTWVYGALFYILIGQTVTDIKILQKTIIYWILLLMVTVPIEFLHYAYTNYHSLIAVVGRLHKPMLNGIDDAYMVIPIFILLSWVVRKETLPRKRYQVFAIISILTGLAIIYLNNGRMLGLLTVLGLLVFLVVQRLNFRVYLYIVLIPIFLFTLNLSLQPEHAAKLLQTFSSVFSAIGDYKKDESAADRVIEFKNVHETLKEDKTMLFGQGWGGLWREYYFQPGRGSLAAYADKTLTVHSQTHVLFSQLFVNCGYLGTAILCLAFFSLWVHFYYVYRTISATPHPHSPSFPLLSKRGMKEGVERGERGEGGVSILNLKPIMLGLLFAYPIYFYFGTVMQIGITLGTIIGFLRRVDIFST